MNYYELLEISPSASVEVIRNAYKTLAKKYHPDTYKGDPYFADAKMKLLNEAVSVLEDEGKRNEYNKINGINPLSKSGYSDYGRNNMLNFDENGEPIFFSYDDLGDDDSNVKNDGKSSDEYIDIIDGFFDRKGGKKSKPAKESSQSAKNKDYASDYNDIAEDISNISENSNGSSISEIEVEETGENETDGYGNIYYSEETEPEELKTNNIKRAKSRTKSRAKAQYNKSRIYYIILASLIAGIVFFGVLDIQSVDWKNIKEIMSGVLGSSNGDSEKVGNFGIDAENTSGEEIYTTTYEQTPVIIEPVTEPVIESSDAITIEPAETSSGAVTPEVIYIPTTLAPPTTTAKPKPTNPPETTVNTTTQPQTEPTIESTEPTTIETTEAPATTAEPTTELVTDAPTTEAATITETEVITDPPVTEPETVIETAPVTDPPTTEFVPEETPPPASDINYDNLTVSEEQ